MVGIPFAVGRKANNWTTFLYALEPLVRLVHAVAVARRLAAECVGNNARVVAGAIVHSLYAVKVFANQLRVV